MAVARRLLGEALLGRWKLFALSLVCMIGVAGFTAALAYSTRLIVNDVFVASNASAAIGIAFLVMGIALGKSVFEYANAVIAVMFNRSRRTTRSSSLRNTITIDVWLLRAM